MDALSLSPLTTDWTTPRGGEDREDQIPRGDYYRPPLPPLASLALSANLFLARDSQFGFLNRPSVLSELVLTFFSPRHEPRAKQALIGR